MSNTAVRAQGGIELLAQLENAGAITRTGLLLPPDLPWEQYEALALMLGHLHRKSAWLIGDLINFGEKVYGEKYTQAIELTQLHEQTLINYASVCAHIPQQRRRMSLSFAVHAAVAYKDPEEQEMWLSKAEENGWKRRELRAAMNGGEPARDPGPETEVLPPMAGSLVSNQTTLLLQGLREIYDAEGVTLWLAHAVENNWGMKECLQRVDVMKTGAYV